MRCRERGAGAGQAGELGVGGRGPGGVVGGGGLPFLARCISSLGAPVSGHTQPSPALKWEGEAEQMEGAGAQVCSCSLF